MDTGGEDEKNQLREKNVGGKEGRKEGRTGMGRR